MQGTVLAPLKCSVTIDTLGKDMLNDDDDILYKYAGYIKTPSLTYLNDILAITKCSSSQLITMNAIIQSKIDNKRLKFGKGKCS